MVSIAGVAHAQPTAQPGGAVILPGAIPEAGDPTPETGTACAWHLLPAASGRSVDTPFDPIAPLGWLFDTTSGNVASWANTPGLATWTPDRRPMMTVQLSSAGFGQNPHGNRDTWWIARYFTDAGGKTRIHDDVAEDQRSPNIPELGGTFNSRYDWLVDGNNQYLNAPNNVPDQFDALIRTILRWREYGVRRVMLHLPAGINGGKYLGYAAGHSGDPNYRVYGGTNQSMNQFHAMPAWKRHYFLGVDAEGNPAPNAWTAFKSAHPEMDIEVYVGGGLPQNSIDLGTEPTNNSLSTNPDDLYSGALRDVRQAYLGLNGSGQEVRGPVWREWYSDSTPGWPIDPRKQFWVRGSGGGGVGVWELVPGNLDQVYNQLSPWISSGIKRIWLDAASENNRQGVNDMAGWERRWGALELAHNPWIRNQNIHIGGETIPTINIVNPNGSITEILDDCAVANMPWFANFQVVSSPNSGTTGPRHWKNYAMTTLARDTTEVHLLDDTSFMDWSQYQYAREHGYVVSAYNAYGTNPKEAEMMKRWYSIGKIRIADFNGDGVINATNPSLPNDYEMAHAAVERSKAFAEANNRQIFPAVFGNGDFDGNGTINDLDWFYFDLVWQQGGTLVRDYQAAGNENHDY